MKEVMDLIKGNMSLILLLTLLGFFLSVFILEKDFLDKYIESYSSVNNVYIQDGDFMTVEELYSESVKSDTRYSFNGQMLSHTTHNIFQFKEVLTSRGYTVNLLDRSTYELTN